MTKTMQVPDMMESKLCEKCRKIHNTSVFCD